MTRDGKSFPQLSEVDASSDAGRVQLSRVPIRAGRSVDGYPLRCVGILIPKLFRFLEPQRAS